MRFAKARDANHGEIRDLLRKVPGVAVLDTGSMGGGHSDLLVRVRDTVLWLEVKDPEQIPSKQALSPLEEKFKAFVGAGYHVVKTKKEALAVVMAAMKPRPRGGAAAAGESADKQKEASIETR